MQIKRRCTSTDKEMSPSRKGKDDSFPFALARVVLVPPPAEQREEEHPLRGEQSALANSILRYTSVPRHLLCQVLE